MFFPRLAIVLVVIFSDYIGEACQTTIWPLLGFFFMPLTTLAYAWAWHVAPTGSVQGLPLVFVILAALMDVGIISGNASNRQVRTYCAKATGQ